jgi:hypothetical protein
VNFGGETSCRAFTLKTEKERQMTLRYTLRHILSNSLYTKNITSYNLIIWAIDTQPLNNINKSIGMVPIL